jgi:hypothetical protein
MVSIDLLCLLTRYSFGITRQKGSGRNAQCAVSSDEARKIERYDHSVKNENNLQRYYLPWELDQEIARFIGYFNNERPTTSHWTMSHQRMYIMAGIMRSLHGANTEGTSGIIYNNEPLKLSLKEKLFLSKTL